MSLKPIFLIGYMACGKTTLGKAIATGFPGLVDFIDLDEAIVASAGRSIPEIFATDGEAAFRALEADTLCRMAAHASKAGPTVIACGGGTPCHGNNLDRMLSIGTVVWLRASRERTLSRLAQCAGSRPLVNGLDDEALEAFVDKNLESRIPFYSRAHAVFDSSRLENPTEIKETTATFVSRFLPSLL